MNSANNTQTNVTIDGNNASTANFDLSAALDYYGSDRARQDFLAGRDEPEELLKNSNSNGSNARNMSVVDHLFESQGMARQSNRQARATEKP